MPTLSGDIERLLSDVDAIQEHVRTAQHHATTESPKIATTVVTTRLPQKTQSTQAVAPPSIAAPVYIYPPKAVAVHTFCQTDCVEVPIEHEIGWTQTGLSFENCVAGVEVQPDIAYSSVQTENSDSDSRLIEAKELNKRLIKQLERLEMENTELRNQLVVLPDKYQELVKMQEEQLCSVEQALQSSLEECKRLKSDAANSGTAFDDITRQLEQACEERSQLELLVKEGAAQLDEAETLLQFQSSKIESLEADKQSLFEALRQEPDLSDNFTQTDTGKVKVYEIAVETEFWSYSIDGSSETTIECRNKKVQACLCEFEVAGTERTTQTNYTCYECNELQGVVQNYKEQLEEHSLDVEEKEEEIDELQLLISDLEDENSQGERRQHTLEKENAAQSQQLEEFAAVMETIDSQLREFKDEILARRDQIRILEAEKLTLQNEKEELADRLERARAAFE